MQCICLHRKQLLWSQKLDTPEILVGPIQSQLKGVDHRPIPHEQKNKPYLVNERRTQHKKNQKHAYPQQSKHTPDKKHRDMTSGGAGDSQQSTKTHTPHSGKAFTTSLTPHLHGRRHSPQPREKQRQQRRHRAGGRPIQPRARRGHHERAPLQRHKVELR